MCANLSVFGFASADATGTLEVRCTASRCKRQGHNTIHLFNVQTGEYVTEYVPKDAPRSARSTDSHG